MKNWPSFVTLHSKPKKSIFRRSAHVTYNKNGKMKTHKIILSSLLIFGSTFMNCTSDDEENMDETAPTISIISPDPDQNYVAEWGGAWPEGEPVTLEAKGIDDVKIITMTVTVTNSIGDIVFEKTIENVSNNEKEFIISENYISADQDVFTVIFTARDSSGNIGTSTPRTFKYV